MNDPPAYYGADLRFSSIVEGHVGGSRFLSRKWLIDDVETELQDPDRPFVLLVGEPGSGKSALVAEAAATHPDWLIYFIRRDQRQPLASIATHDLLLRVGYQLAAQRPELFDPRRVEITIEQRVGRAGSEVVGATVKRLLTSPFFVNALRIRQHVEQAAGTVEGLRLEELVCDPRQLDEADLAWMALWNPASTLQQLEPSATIVVVVDALDEVRYHTTEDSLVRWLGNVGELPVNVRFLLTSRPPAGQIDWLVAKQKSRIRQIPLRESDKRVQTDVRRYAEQLARIPTLRDVTATESAPAEFAHRAALKADGNIGYLDALGRAIDRAAKAIQDAPSVDDAEQHREALRALLALEELPPQLEQLYEFFLDQIRSFVSTRAVRVGRDSDTGKTLYQSAWAAVHRQILGVLTVAFQPLTIEQLITLGAIDAERTDVADAIDQLRQFLDEEEAGRYRLYHATVADYLASVPAENRFCEGARTWHSRIADHYWSSFHRDWSGCADEYCLDNLVAHLASLGDSDRLCAVFTKSWMEARHRNSSYSYSALAADVDTAWDVLAAPPDPAVAGLIRLKMVLAVIDDLVHRGDPRTLVRLGRDAEALGLARSHKEVEERIEALLTIYDETRDMGSGLHHALVEAYELAASTFTDADSVRRLCRVAEAMARSAAPELVEVLDRAASNARLVSSIPGRIDALVDVARHQTAIEEQRAGELLDEAHGLLSELDEPADRATALCRIAWVRFALDPARAHLDLEEARGAADAVPTDSASDGSTNSDRYRPRALLNVWIVMQHLQHPHSDDVLAAATAAFDTVAQPSAPYSWETASWHTDIAKTLLATGESDKAVEALRRIEDRDSNHQALLTLAPDLARTAKQELEVFLNELGQQQAESSDRSLRAKIGHNSALLLLALERRDEAARVAMNLEHEYWRSYALEKVTEAMASAKELDAAEATSKLIEDSLTRGRAEGAVATALIQAGETARAQAIAQRTQDDNTRWRILQGIALHLARHGDPAAHAAYDRARLAEEPALMKLGTFKGAVHQVVRGLIATGDLDAAYAVARHVRDDWTRSTCLIEVAEAMTAAVDARATNALSEARAAADAMEDDYYRDGVLATLGAAYAKNGQLDLAREVANSTRMWNSASKILKAAIVTLVEAGDSRADALFGSAQQTASGQDDTDFPAETLIEIAAQKARQNDHASSTAATLAANAVQDVERPLNRARLSCRLARCIARSSPDLSAELIADAERLVAASTDRFMVETVLADAALGWVDIGKLEKAVELATAIEGWGGRTVAITGCLQPLIDRGQSERAEQLVDSEADPHAHGKLMVALASALANNADARADEVFAEAERLIRDRWISFSSENELYELATALAESERVSAGLRVLQTLGLDDTAYFIGCWLPTLEARGTIMARPCLAEIVDVAGWYREKWRGIGEILATRPRVPPTNAEQEARGNKRKGPISRWLGRLFGG